MALALMKRPRILAQAVLFLLAVLVTACARTPEPRVLLVTLDTTRADRLTPYGSARDTAPALAALARGGVLFTRAYASMPTTDPSHATFLTGVHPRRHGVTRNGQRAVDGLPSMPARLQARGLRTATFLSRRHLDPRRMNIPGFDRIDIPSRRERRAAGTVTAALKWIAGHAEGGWFLWVHLIDPHAPYDPPAPYDSRFGAGPPEKRLGKMGWLEPGEKYPAEVIDRNVALYDGEIAWMDQWVGRLVAAAEALPGGPPLIVVAGDHGESLCDLEKRFAYAFAHGEFLYDHQTRIPLIFRWKGKLPEGRVVSDLFAAVDLAPTILDLIGEEEPLGGEGVSRADLLRGKGGAGAEDVIVQRRSYDDPEQAWLATEEFAIVHGSRKLIANRLKGDELFDLAADPGETSNLALAEPATLAVMKERLLAWLRAHPAAAQGERRDEETLEELRSLGYVD
jgi:arylsulfatase A-like enzyme